MFKFLQEEFSIVAEYKSPDSNHFILAGIFAALLCFKENSLVFHWLDVSNSFFVFLVHKVSKRINRIILTAATWAGCSVLEGLCLTVLSMMGPPQNPRLLVQS